MREFCRVAAFAIALTVAIVTLAVALWNEGCGQHQTPRPVPYAGRAPRTLEPWEIRIKAEKDEGPQDRILIVPSQ